MKPLWGMYVPTKLIDRDDEEEILKYSNGLTHSFVNGTWVDKEGNKHYDVSVYYIFSATRKEVYDLASFFSKKYNQQEIMAFRISDEIIFFTNPAYQTWKAPA